MQGIIEADILITDKSSLSYVTALISDGIKIYEQCGFPLLSDWIMRGHSAILMALGLKISLHGLGNRERARRDPCHRHEGGDANAAIKITQGRLNRFL